MPNVFDSSVSNNIHVYVSVSFSYLTCEIFVALCLEFPILDYIQLDLLPWFHPGLTGSVWSVANAFQWIWSCGSRLWVQTSRSTNYSANSSTWSTSCGSVIPASASGVQSDPRILQQRELQQQDKDQRLSHMWACPMCSHTFRQRAAVRLSCCCFTATCLSPEANPWGGATLWKPSRTLRPPQNRFEPHWGATCSTAANRNLKRPINSSCGHLEITHGLVKALLNPSRTPLII